MSAPTAASGEIKVVRRTDGSTADGNFSSRTSAGLARATAAHLAPRAGAIALDYPVYDCFYLALSEAQNPPLVSADRRLIAKAKGTVSAPRTLPLKEFWRPG